MSTADVNMTSNEDAKKTFIPEPPQYAFYATRDEFRAAKKVMHDFAVETEEKPAAHKPFYVMARQLDAKGAKVVVHILNGTVDRRKGKDRTDYVIEIARCIPAGAGFQIIAGTVTYMPTGIPAGTPASTHFPVRTVRVMDFHNLKNMTITGATFLDMASVKGSFNNLCFVNCHWPNPKSVVYHKADTKTTGVFEGDDRRAVFRTYKNEAKAAKGAHGMPAGLGLLGALGGGDRGGLMEALLLKSILGGRL